MDRPLLVADRKSIRRFTSPSTVLCFTMRFMRILVPFTLATCTALRSSYMRCSVILRMRIGVLSFGAMRIQGVRSCQTTISVKSLTNTAGRANAACILACYMVLIQNWPPHLALAPIAQMDPPCMPFRDAGYSQADYIINIQDVVYGVWKAKEEGLCGLKDFCLEECVTFSVPL